ncbi:hypothetical protein Tco_1253346 [Tanacetum coccineum]
MHTLQLPSGFLTRTGMATHMGYAPFPLHPRLYVGDVLSSCSAMERGIPVMSAGVQEKALTCFHNISISPDLYSAEKFHPMVGWVAVVWCLLDLLLGLSALDFLLCPC